MVEKTASSKSTKLFVCSQVCLPEIVVDLKVKIFFMSSRLSNLSVDPSIPFSLSSMPLEKIEEKESNNSLSPKDKA